MDLIKEKVKDIVEVRVTRNLLDFTSDPAETLSAYFFTDITADLMAKWLERIANVSRFGGSAFALAGYRGVGKSHFLSVVGALAAYPELRSRVSDRHVASMSERLPRRRYPVAFIRRGLRETFFEELIAGLAVAFGIEESLFGGTFNDALETAAKRAGEIPLIVLVDTAIERRNRVARDDGAKLGELAVAAKGMNIFIGVALDDDIAGADGSNSAIAANFGIDFLDQEHLYRIVDAHIFPKTNQAQSVLRDVYNYFREVLPDFKWSLQKFSSLYPLHPIILEIAPFVRLYVPDYALLGFASEAGERIMGRPANSLIALDEVFDKTESDLRKVNDLSDVFTAYDGLNSEVVGKIPVMQRLQAKLVLKSLLLMSLRGRGVTPAEIGAAMLIFDEKDPASATRSIEGILRQFSSARPNDISIDQSDGESARFSFRVHSTDKLNEALDNAMPDLPESAMLVVMRRLFCDRFSDCVFPQESMADKGFSMETSIEWRGGWRRGLISWDSSSDPDNANLAESRDWKVVINLGNESPPISQSGDGMARVLWKTDALRPDEKETILRYYALTTNAVLRSDFDDQVRAAVQSHALSAEKIWNRSFLEDSKLVIDGFDYNLTEEARASHTLSELLSIMLAPMFETRFPEHPVFERPVDISDVASIIAGFYNPANHNLAEIQELVRLFSVPLGLAESGSSGFVPVSAERLASLDSAKAIIALSESADGEIVPLRAIYSELGKSPTGLVREAQKLFLAALVAEGKIEFVTGKGDRISRRSLDLEIIWDDISGIARPRESTFSSKRLARWASIITRDKTFESMSGIEDHERLRAAFIDWLAEWRSDNVLAKFDAIPDEIIISDMWQLAARCSRTFGMLATAIESAVNGSMSFEECVNRIAEAFLDSESEIEKRRAELHKLKTFVAGAKLFDTIDTHLAQCEITDYQSIENARERLWFLMDLNRSDPNEERNFEAEQIWSRFRDEYEGYYRERHDRIMRSPDCHDRFRDFIRSDIWWKFENLASLQLFDPHFRYATKDLCERIWSLNCTADTKQIFNSMPFCSCGFRLCETKRLEELQDALSKTVSSGLEAFRRTLTDNQDVLTPLFVDFADEVSDSDAADAAHGLVRFLQEKNGITSLSDTQIKVLIDVANIASANVGGL